MKYTAQAVRRLWETKLKEGVVFGAACAVMVSVAVLVSKTDVSWNMFVKWAFLAVFTVVTFGYFMGTAQAMWKLKSFWVSSLLALVVHCAITIEVGRHMHYWPVVWVPLMVGELIGMVYARDQMFVKRPLSR